MRRLEFYQDIATVVVDLGDGDCDFVEKMQWHCTDGISTFYGDTQAEAASHFGVPVGDFGDEEAQPMYYLIESEYVGPNEKDSEGNWKGDTRVLGIYTKPGKTNQSHEERTSGWLGTTCDNCRTAHGEYKTIVAAREAAHKMGFVSEHTSKVDGMDDEDGLVESWISESATREQWDAGDWFINGLGKKGTCSECGISAKTTDKELQEKADLEDEKAEKEGIELHGTLDLFIELRDELKEAGE